jgi:phenylalanyl-tRNA synthetase beta chain
MPTISVDKAELFERLGHQYTTEEFDRLCFDYGLELDEDTTAEVEAAIKKGLPAERPQLKIEVPANRCAASWRNRNAHLTSTQI